MHRTAKRYPDKTGLICVGTSWSFVEFDAVLAHCNEHIAGFKAPKAVVFTDALPKNPSGKLLKRDLRQRYKDVFSEN